VEILPSLRDRSKIAATAEICIINIVVVSFSKGWACFFTSGAASHFFGQLSAANFFAARATINKL